MEFKKYTRKNYTLATPWTPEIDMTLVSVSEEDKKNGSPKIGDMIGQNPNNKNDMWLIAKEYFEANLELAE